MPVTFEASQRSVPASELIGTGASGPSALSAQTCGGESSNSVAIAWRRCLWSCHSSSTSCHASPAGVRPMVAASDIRGHGSRVGGVHSPDRRRGHPRGSWRGAAGGRSSRRSCGGGPPASAGSRGPSSPSPGPASGITQRSQGCSSASRASPIRSSRPSQPSSANAGASSSTTTFVRQRRGSTARRSAAVTASCDARVTTRTESGRSCWRAEVAVQRQRTPEVLRERAPEAPGPPSRTGDRRER